MNIPNNKQTQKIDHNVEMLKAYLHQNKLQIEREETTFKINSLLKIALMIVLLYSVIIHGTLYVLSL
jgi:hypothetical protein